MIRCDSGTATASGTLIPMWDVTVTLNVPVTNRKNATDNFIDALLLVDEPHSVANPNVPLTLCGAPGVDCAITGNGTGQGVYNGASNRPNVFQGELTGTNTVRFRLPLDNFAAGSRVLRIVNLRGDATQAAGRIPNTITASLSISDGTSLPAAILGIIQPGLVLSPFTERYLPTPPVFLSGCDTSNTFWASNPDAPALPRRIESYAIALNEGSVGSWRPRNLAQMQAAGRYGGLVGSFLADVNQNISGYYYATESGFMNGAAADPAAPVPNVPSTARFPSVRGVDRAGAADFGTRILVKFSNVPTGMQFLLPVEVPLLSLHSRTGSAVMVQSGSQGGMQRVNSNNHSGLAPMVGAGDTATAIYEVVSSDPDLIENLRIPIVVVSAGAFGSSAPIVLTAGLLPAIGAPGPDSAAVIPRFAPVTVSEDAFFISGDGCTNPDLTVSIASGAMNGLAGSVQLGVGKKGTSSSAGTVSVNVRLPAELTATSIGGDGWTCALQTLTCTWPQAVSQLGTNGITVQFTASSSAPDAVTVTATVSGGGDLYPGNNQASTTVNIRTVQSTTRGVVIYTVPAGMVYVVDGVYFQGKKTFLAKVGQTLQVSSPTTQVTHSGSPVIFDGWSDNGALSHGFTVPSGSFTPLVATLNTYPRSMDCYQTAVPPLIRREGLAELIEYLVLTCTGGTPTPAGRPVPQVDVRLTLSAPVTSRIVSPGFSEALLVIDDPHSLSHPSALLLPCGAPGSNDDGSGRCQITAAGALTYDGTAGHANVFQGRPEGVDTIVWKGVPIDPPGFGVERKIQFANVRVNANTVALVPPSLIPPVVGGKFLFDPPVVSISSAENNSAAAFVASSLADSSMSSTSTVQKYAILNSCQPANPQIFSDASKPLDAGGQNGMQATLRAVENQPSTFTSRSVDVDSSNPPGATNTSYPPSARQDVAGYIFNTETGLFAGSSITTVYPATLIPQLNLPPSPAFPAIRGLDLAGKPDSGSRIFFKFSGIPAGVKLFVPSRANLSGAFGGDRGRVSLVSTDENGGGPFSSPAANAAGLVPLAVNGSEAIAVYEVLSTDHFTVESLSVPVAVSFLASQATPGRILVTAGLAPLSTAAIADAASPMPRFAAQSTWQNQWPAVEIAGCGLTLNKSSLSFRATVGQADPAPQPVSVTFSGNSTFAWYVTAPSATWIKVSPASGGTGPGSFTVSPAIAGLAPGTYDGSVSVGSSGQLPVTVAVRLVVDPVTPPPSPNYAGWLDAKSCDAISGWAADRSRLNTSINVSLWTGGSQVYSTLASTSRLDVGAVLNDNGLHGFSFPLPQSLRDGIRRTFSLKFESSSTPVGADFDLTCGTATPPPPPPPATARNTGYFDSASCNAAVGWAADLDRLNQAISVDLVEGSTILGTVLANGNRSDVGTYLGDNGLHGFSISIPDSLKNGVTRTILMRYAGTTQALSNSPKTIQCGTVNPPPPPTEAKNTGFVDYAGCDAVKGWAADLNHLNQAISVDLVEGSTVLGSVLANTSRPDVGSYIGDNGLHGFSIAIPDSLKNGVSRVIQVRFTRSTQTLGNSPKTIQCGNSTPPPPVNANNSGYFDYAGCDAISGWAADRNRLNQAISVDLVEGSTILSTILANASRSDVGNALGDNGLHGFSIATPDSLKNGTPRTIQMRYSGTTQALSNSPKTIQCAGTGNPPPVNAPTNPTGFVDYSGCDVISGWAADRDRLNQAISVDLMEGSAVLTTVVANYNRPDVGTYLGDNGLHGFAIPLPAGLKNGAQRIIQLRYTGTNRFLGNSPRTIQCAAAP